MHAKILTVSVFQTLIHLSRKYGKKYCYPSQETILELLKKYHSVELSRRSLNRWLKYLEDEGYFERRRRITKCDDGRYHFKSTLYILKKKLFVLAGRFGQLVGDSFSWKAKSPKRGDDESSGQAGARMEKGSWVAGWKGVKQALGFE